MSSIYSSSSDNEHVDTNLQILSYNCAFEKENNSGPPVATLNSIIRCEKLVNNLLSLKKVNETIDILLTKFKSRNDSKELCARETYALSDDILKIVNDLKLSCETYLFECANNRPVACDSLQTSLEREIQVPIQHYHDLVVMI